MASLMEPVGEGRPLLGSPSSPVTSAPTPAVWQQLHVRWSRLEEAPPPKTTTLTAPTTLTTPMLTKLSEALTDAAPDGLPPEAPHDAPHDAVHELGKPSPPVYSHLLSTDSGCESEGGASDSAYSTVTSCTSDLVRLQLDAVPFEEAEHAEESSTKMATREDAQKAEAVAQPAATQMAAQTDAVDQRSIRSWSLEAVQDAAAAEPDPCGVSAAAEPGLLMAESRRLSCSQPSLTTSASTASLPICRICHMPSEERAELISPCRCAGTMQYIHTNCLMHWIEVSSRRSKRPPCCELCQYQYQRHKRFRVGRWIVPAVSTRDKVLHSVFIITAIVMITCAVITIFCFKQDSGKRRLMYDEAELTPNETVTLVCGVLFFAGFFIGMYCEVKAKYSMYHLVTRVFYLNQQWFIEEYDRAKDERLAVGGGSGGKGGGGGGGSAV